MTAAPLILDNLSVARAGGRIVSDVSFEVAPGTALALRGPNGVGKSTLLRALAGLLPATGTARLGDRQLGSDDWVDAIAHAGHRDAIKAALSVRENLAFWAALLGGDVDTALAAFDLAPLADRPAGLCSAGQKRRLGLARLALGHRSLWLLDEPTVSLDAGHVARFAELLRAHLDRGGLAVIATHITLGLDLAEHHLTPPEERPAGPGAPSDDPFLSGEFA
ncbi:heme ABC exporter ATP-binding protein CcmA [Roseobacter sp. HKCCA0434]|uniref:heme ABC exporter ATP-binding protein CcmA n=1 Tax=Roseobacter sp. HKCCA0434 TaxID=3079297 RepID=UPI002905B318|nr:heme ABC exporter ATP-binding protein CcmA [Roseobacter sp. HKCCA0434]